MGRLLAAFFGLCLVSIAAESPFTGPTIAGQLAAPPRLETSGLAASRRSADMLWTHDDSGGAATLYAIKTNGELVGALRIKGVKNEDWEDLAAYELDGKAWLLVADTGDNDAKRAHVLLHIVEEPSLKKLRSTVEMSVRPTRTLRVRYEDGPRDCESVAVDVAGRAIYLLTKRDKPPRLYRLDLEPPAGDAIVVARLVGTVARLPQPAKSPYKVIEYLGRRRAEVTAMDFTADGSAALVLTYGELYFFPRRAGEPWGETLARDPMQLPAHGLLQVEAACFSVDGKQIYVAAERDRNLVRYERK